MLILYCVSSTISLCQNSLPQPIPCLNLNENDFDGFSGIYANQNCINVSSSISDVLISNGQNVTLKSGSTISIDGNTSISPSGVDDSFHAFIEESVIDAAWFVPSATPGFVGRYEKLEIGFDLPTDIDVMISEFLNNSIGLNPFDPLDISLEAEILKEGDVFPKTVYGFYYEQYERDLINDVYIADNSNFDWRIRFSPKYTGRYFVKVRLFVNEVLTYTPVEFSFVCVSSDNPGYLVRNSTSTNQDRFLHFHGTGKTFHPIGHSISLPAKQFSDMSKPSTSINYQQAFTDIANYGANFTRIEMGVSSWLPNWDAYNNYNSRMYAMWEFDRLLEHLESIEMYFIMYRHHIEVQDRPIWAAASWQNNPYRIGLGLVNQDEYFSNTEAIRWQKNLLRYMFSRWGYSTSWALYSYSEVDNWLRDYDPHSGSLFDIEDWNNTTQTEDWNSVVLDFSIWLNNEKNYYQNELGYTQLLTATFGTFGHIDNNEGYVFDACDVTGTHNYGQTKDMNWIDRYNAGQYLWDEYQKPFFYEELGMGGGEDDGFLNVYCCSGIDFHNEIWACSFMGSVGTGLNFWWDRGIHLNQYYEDYAPLALFFAYEDEQVWNFEPDKWDDVLNHDNALIETYYLRSEDQEYILGWVHNASYYWRNMYDQNSCIDELVQSATISTPCVYPDGWIQDGTTTNEFSDILYTDSHTSSGGATPIQNSVGPEYNPTFEIHGLKFNPFQFLPFAKKHWYQVDYYDTYNLGPIVETQVVATNMLGVLKPNVLNLDDAHPDYGYKVSYLGFYQDAPPPKSTEYINSNYNIPFGHEEVSVDFTDGLVNQLSHNGSENEILIYPNPNSGKFNINSKQTIDRIEIYDVFGSLIYLNTKIAKNQVNIELNLAPGVYLVQVYNGGFVNSFKIIVR